jgi:DsbC/DsbD-like thiol-disulfide interchange protein
MRRSQAAVSIIVLAVLFAVEQACAFQTGGPPTSAGKVKAAGKLSVDKVPAGSTFKAVVVLSIAEGWHINSHVPTYDYLIATTLELQQHAGIAFSDVRYPPGRNMKFGFASDSLSVYEKTVTIFFTGRTSGRIPTGRINLRAKLEVQACNNQVCIAPATIDVLIPIEIVPASTKPKQINGSVFAPFARE